MRKAEANLKSIAMSLVVFSLLIGVGTLFMTGIISDYHLDRPSDIDDVYDLSTQSKDFTDKLIRQPNNSTGIIAKVSDTIYDSWLGKVISSMTVMYESYNLFSTYIFTIGGIVDIPVYVIRFLESLLLLGVSFAVIYFIRSGK